MARVNGTGTPVKQVLIAHQSTIPPYRVRFYSAMERLRPDWWRFTVVHDAAESRRQYFAQVDPRAFPFATIETRSISMRLGTRRLVLQGFPRRAGGFDLLIVGGEVRNLSYLASHLWHLFGLPVACWGHGRDKPVQRTGSPAHWVQLLKFAIARHAAGYFAYTQRSCDHLLAQGVDPKRLFRLNNTVDIGEERDRFLQRRPRREALRGALGFTDERVLIFAGRLEGGKRVDFLAAAFAELRRTDRRYRLLVVGAGDPQLAALLCERGGDAVRYLGHLPDPALADAFAASDLYVLPGAVGLGPLHALCFDLVPVVIDSPMHAPEYEYLSTDNSIICRDGCSAAEYAAQIHAAFDDRDGTAQRRRNAWPSIEHLTIDAMARNFIAGVNRILRPSAGAG